MKGDRSTGALVMSLVAVGLLAGAYLTPWFAYDFSTGRQTPPDGPQPEEQTGEETSSLTFYADGWEGDTAPSDPSTADRAVLAIPLGLFAAATTLVLVVFGELPVTHRVLRRPVSLALLGTAFGATLTVALLAAWWIPASMAGHGVTGPFTARLDEPEGYTRAYMHTAWYLVLAAVPTVLAAGLWKFQAGPEAREVLQEHLADGKATGSMNASRRSSP